MKAKLREDFIKNYKNSMAELTVAIGRKDLKSAQDIVHILKNAARLIEETKLANAAEALENLLIDGVRPPGSYMKSLETELKNVLDSLSVSVNIKIPHEALPILEALAPLLQARIADCIEQVPALKNYPEMETLVRQVECCEFKDAIITLQSLMARAKKS
ncbi:MAG: Hpt domain-containing protein [Defluviitaleaceae bacterium]|nr:Hpt domain-containing protein [Defluviitaleaceae bacterium]